MCGRYSIFAPPDELEERFDAAFVTDPRPRYNAAPGQSLPVIRDASRDAITGARWGLVPSWADGPSGGFINARAETLGEKPAFRDAYAERRCLVLADGFYEWVETDVGKRPYRITRLDGDPFALAGLWETWTPAVTQTGLDEFAGGADDAGSGPDRSVEPLETFTIVTREPTPLLADYHHRMALLLRPDDEAAWLDGDRVEAFDPPADDELRAYPVSTLVNDPANDSPAVVEEVSP
ncbi:SOS response-associated peptidase [Halomarina pelagica]|uniref:SOS response-associated peptidase n=1 Tax=Halomarina pelagica TaxID=2961599 RepID=UPI0020C29EC7|nr:SOS response-associated peptidase [Halomarina sp. BND7]